MGMKVIDSLRAKLESIGATLDEGAGYVLCCDAPKGYVWKANEMPCVSIQCATNSQSWYAEAIRDEERLQLSMGLKKVTNEAELKSIQWDIDDDSWCANADAPDFIAWPKSI